MANNRITFKLKDYHVLVLREMDEHLDHASREGWRTRSSHTTLLAKVCNLSGGGAVEKGTILHASKLVQVWKGSFLECRAAEASPGLASIKAKSCRKTVR